MSDWADMGLDFLGSDWSGGDIDWGALATGIPEDLIGSDWASGVPGSNVSNTGLDLIGSDWATGQPGSGVSNTGQFGAPGWGGGGGGGAGGISLADILKGAGQGLGVTDKGGEVNWGNLLSLLAPIGAGIYGKNRVDKATDQQLEAIRNAQSGLTGLSAENKALYAPYRSAGDVGLQRLLTQPQSNLSGMPMARPLAPDYRALGSGRGLSLSNVMRGR